LCDRDGRPLEATGVTNVEGAAAAAATTVDELSAAGDLLTLGGFEKMTIKGPSAAQVTIAQRGAIAAVTMEPKQSTAELEARLADPSWDMRKTSVREVTGMEEPVAVRPTPPRREAVFAGQLQLFCLPDLLEFLRGARRTGTLHLHGNDGDGMVRMRHGRITGATSPRTARIGEYLVRQAVLTPDQLRSALQAQSGEPVRRMLGRVLIDRQVATAADVRKALVAQVQDSVRELKDWVVGQFAFETEPASEPTLAEIELELDPQAVLLTILTEEDEANNRNAR